MVFTTSSCLNLSPPTPSSKPSLTPQTPQVAWKKNEESWRKRCVLGVASMIIGLEMSNLAIDESHIAIAEEYMPLVAGSKQEVPKWSDKRTCPAWRMNSLETIVPENLPRPSARRRWEAVGFSKIAPTVKVAVKSSSTGCFSM